MPYRFAIKRCDYSDYASGRVFYGLPGQPAFPIRLASEILQRCVAILRAGGHVGPYVLHDPLCGGGYLLSTLVYLHWMDVGQVIGSDVDAQALSLARRNLSLLTVEGIERRIDEIQGMLSAYRKPSHRAAFQSAQRLKARLLAMLETHQVETRIFQANAMDGHSLREGLGGRVVDIVLTDVPYGQRSTWQICAGVNVPDAPPLWRVLDALSAVVSERTVVAIASDKAQKVAHQGYRRIDRFRLGKRKVSLLQLSSLS